MCRLKRQAATSDALAKSLKVVPSGVPMPRFAMTDMSMMLTFSILPTAGIIAAVPDLLMTLVASASKGTAGNGGFGVADIESMDAA